jgi:hypothetical protein
VLATILYKLQKQISQTPCPVQISNPGDNLAVRNSVRDVIAAIQNMQQNQTIRIVQPYNPNAVYLVITGKYLTAFRSARFTGEPVDKINTLFSQYPYIPIATMSNGKIYGLAGSEVWPSMGGNS